MPTPTDVRPMSFFWLNGPHTDATGSATQGHRYPRRKNDRNADRDLHSGRSTIPTLSALLLVGYVASATVSRLLLLLGAPQPPTPRPLQYHQYRTATWADLAARTGMTGWLID